MSYCTHSYDQVPCPDICSETEEHSHWRCTEGHAWLFYPDLVDPGMPVELAEFVSTTYDLTQPARCIYPVRS